ncbi:class I SAM-dependent methyltransferase [Parashewanella curva]|uniref:Class I SAM-dependent methyltransferase n=1 Tax=Parashewanella curva TaxID=2338552 RepID=A0A3L8PXN1_9GAMM|nr:class I SAM-dependent methyltransferase [Parashewanella curva]RLV60025.1 class I SAM-dependent methyltransferase [Parashewanella curva]
MITSDYYNQNAQAFYDGSINVNVQPLYDRFLPYIPKGGSIIDAGCGSGRDSKFFAEQGYQVTAFDASEQLVELAKAHTQLTIFHSTFLSFEVKKGRFDAIWACASLLHVSQTELNKTFKHLAQFLKVGGVFYCSFKLGDEEVESGGRRFTNVNEASLSSYLVDAQLEIKEQWLSDDLRPGREGEKWLNALLVKKNS